MILLYSCSIHYLWKCFAQIYHPVNFFFISNFKGLFVYGIQSWFDFQSDRSISKSHTDERFCAIRLGVGEKSYFEHHTSRPIVELRARWQRKIFRLLTKKTVYRSGVDQNVLATVRYRVRADGRRRDDYQRTAATVEGAQKFDEQVLMF